MHILYLPKRGLAPKNDRVYAVLVDFSVVERAFDFADAANILSLQHQHQTYDYDAFVAGEEPLGHLDDIRHVRSSAPALPIVTLTSEKPISEVRARVLDAGADDCIPIRHVSPNELRATVMRRVLARYERGCRTIRVGNVEFDIANRTAARDTEQCVFPTSHWRVLEPLVIRSPRVVRTDLLHALHGSRPESNTLQVAIVKIRRRIHEIDGNLGVQNCYGLGYALRVMA